MLSDGRYRHHCVTRRLPTAGSQTMSEIADAAVATVREHTTRASQVVTLLAVVIPPLGLVATGIGLWGVALSWIDVLLFLVLYVLTGLGTTVGYHRLFTHRSFETTKTVRAAFAILGSMTIQAQSP